MSTPFDDTIEPGREIIKSSGTDQITCKCASRPREPSGADNLAGPPPVQDRNGPGQTRRDQARRDIGPLNRTSTSGAQPIPPWTHENGGRTASPQLNHRPVTRLRPRRRIASPRPTVPEPLACDRPSAGPTLRCQEFADPRGHRSSLHSPVLRRHRTTARPHCQQHRGPR
jgi:hypothetical protein